MVRVHLFEPFGAGDIPWTASPVAKQLCSCHVRAQVHVRDVTRAGVDSTPSRIAAPWLLPKIRPKDQTIAGNTELRQAKGLLALATLEAFQLVGRFLASVKPNEQNLPRNLQSSGNREYAASSLGVHNDSGTQSTLLQVIGVQHSWGER